MNLILEKLLKNNNGLNPYEVAELIFKLANEYKNEAESNFEGYKDLAKWSGKLRKEGREEDAEDVMREALELFEFAEYLKKQGEEVEGIGLDLIEMANEED